MEIKQLPQELNAESAILSGMMNDNTALVTAINLIDEKMFYLNKHRIIFSTMKSMFSHKEDIDLITLMAKLGSKLEQCGGSEYLNGVNDVLLSGANINSYINTITEKSNLRSQILAFKQGIEKCYAGENSKEVFSKTIQELQSMERSEKLFSAQQATDNTMDKLQRNIKVVGSDKTFWLGLHSIDRYLHPESGKFMVIAARPSHGKSALMQQGLLHSAYRGRKTCLISLEVGETEVTENMLSHISGVDSFRITDPSVLEEGEIFKINQAAEKLYEQTYYINTKRNVSPVDIRAIALQAKAKMGGLDNIIIDHMQLTSNPDYKKMIDRITENSGQFKTIAGDLECNVIALSQLNRGLESRDDKRPKLSDLRESGAIEQDADIVVMICSLSKYKNDPQFETGFKFMGAQYENEELDRLALVSITKNRGGKLWESPVNYDKTTGRFKDWGSYE